MQVFYSKKYRSHKGFNSSFECPERVGRTIEKLINSGISVHAMPLNSTISIPKKWTELISNLDSRFNDITTKNCQVCTYENTEDECSMCMSHVNNLKIISSIDGDTTYMCATTCDTITDLLKTIVYILNKQLDEHHDVFILSRPPGHHSDNKNPSGFCLINNISLCVDYLRQFIHKIAIVDWDVHHGNGTQSIFYDRKDVLFIDIHRDNFYPHTGKKSEQGDGEGIGYTVNIPLNKGADENEYLECFDSIIIPKMIDFNPDWILVSCGFDAHINDQLGGMKLKSTSYGLFNQKLRLLKKPLTYIMEGGYNLDAISESVLEIVKS